MNVCDGDEGVIDFKVGVESSLREPWQQLVWAAIIVETKVQLIIRSCYPVAATKEAMAGSERGETSADGPYRDGSVEYHGPI